MPITDASIRHLLTSCNLAVAVVKAPLLFITSAFLEECDLRLCSEKRVT